MSPGTRDVFTMIGVVVSAVFVTAVVGGLLYGVSCDISRWWHRRTVRPTPEPVSFEWTSRDEDLLERWAGR